MPLSAVISSNLFSVALYGLLPVASRQSPMSAAHTRNISKQQPGRRKETDTCSLIRNLSAHSHDSSRGTDLLPRLNNEDDGAVLANKADTPSPPPLQLPRQPSLQPPQHRFVSTLQVHRQHDKTATLLYISSNLGYIANHLYFLVYFGNRRQFLTFPPVIYTIKNPPRGWTSIPFGNRGDEGGIEVMEWSMGEAV
ncbi:hypothetical protein M378DRAFT_199356 [Amanita muscaria Koide BX008]|uniref:Uncharacterized protein n=1 Tax=Amanita muscaria (strain Koide BX008) TaxID=946122 RepID=A0A0C2T689_AMAMK|nr:hypothetical protein M378DRAFT_199356 [Amanita muscaria Koide BX008]